jgi:amino acid transporter
MTYTIIILIALIAIFLYIITIVGCATFLYYEKKDECLYESIRDVVEDMAPVCFIPLINTITLVLISILYVILSICYLIWFKTSLHKWWEKFMNIKIK